jgi:uncharacterized protein (DUF3084 family)
MEQLSIQEIQQQLKEVSTLRKQQEENLESLKSEFSKIQVSISDSLENLQELKDKESSLQNKLFLIQKENIKEALSINGIKKMFSDSNPLVKKIKEKSKEIKEVFDGTHLDKEWIDEHYDKYKETCIKKGEEIKSKEEFKKIALTLKNAKDEVTAIQFGDFFNKAGEKIQQASKKIQETLSSQFQETVKETIEEPKEEVIIVEIVQPTTKKEGLESWIKNSDREIPIEKDYSDEKIPEFYDEYVSYLNILFDNNTPIEVVYSIKGSAFKTALKKAINIK